MFIAKYECLIIKEKVSIVQKIKPGVLCCKQAKSGPFILCVVARNMLLLLLQSNAAREAKDLTFFF